MALTINASSLASRSIRSSIGVRKISTSLASPQKNSSGGIIGWIMGGVTRFLGWALAGVWDLLKRFVSWSFSAIWGLCVSTFQFVWTFDWNQSDEQLDAYIKSQYQQLVVQAAGGLGQMMGWLVCGALPGVVMFAFNEALGAHILKEVGEEALEELIPVIGNLVQATLRTLGRQALVGTYKRLRSWLVGNNPMYTKSDEQLMQDLNASYSDRWKAGLYPDAESAQAAAREAYEKQQKVRDAAKSGFERKPWSFQKAFEEWREDTFPEGWQDAVEEFVEEFSDACIEAGYVVAGSLDSYYAQSKIMAPAIVGNQQIVMIDFDRQLSQDRAAAGLDPATGLPLNQPPTSP